MSVYSCATDQITCDTVMKSGQARSLSLHLPSPFPCFFYFFFCSPPSVPLTWNRQHEKADKFQVCCKSVHVWNTASIRKKAAQCIIKCLACSLCSCVTLLATLYPILCQWTHLCRAGFSACRHLVTYLKPRNAYRGNGVKLRRKDSQPQRFKPTPWHICQSRD